MSEQYLRVKDLEKILDRSESHCYSVIKKLNSELKSKGYHTERGRVPKKYFFERYGLDYQ